MVIFVGGIHGVGKGKICTELSSLLSIPHFSSSKLLNWDELNVDKSNKFVNNFEFTQSRLLNSLKKIKLINKDFFLDGHFCMFDELGNPSKIDIKTFEAIAPSIIVLVSESAKVVQERIYKRDKKLYDIEKLKKLADLELKYAKLIAKKLGVHFVNIKNQKVDNLIKLIKEHESIIRY
jgi:adenylate kinase